MSRLGQQKLSPVMRLAVQRAQRCSGLIKGRAGWVGVRGDSEYTGFATGTVQALVDRGLMRFQGIPSAQGCMALLVERSSGK